MHLIRRLRFSAQVCAAIVLLSTFTLAAPPTNETETDPELQANGEGWRLQKAKITDKSRPRVLLIGDSILNGYLAGVTKALEGKAYIDAWVTPTSQGDKRLPKIIGEVVAEGPYDVIHFNLGLHGWQPGRIPEGQFKPLTAGMVQAFKQHAPQAKLIWASTTPVTTKGTPGELDAEINPTIVEHNRMAAEVMADERVEIDDLYALMLPKLELAAGDRFHWTPPAKAMQVVAVAASITKALSNKQTKASDSAPPFDLNKIAAALEPNRKIVYKSIGDRNLGLHLFEPEGWLASDRRSCFVIIHGGGWTGGEPRRMYPFADHFRKLGMVGVSVQYRLIDKKAGTTPFECVKDGRSAIRYLRSHAAELGIDPNKIVVGGGSAGGHVAAATALFDGVDDPSDDLKVSPVPNALVLLFPVIDTSKDGYGNAKCGERWRDISPVDHVVKNLPSAIVFHGTGDTVTPFAGAERFDKEMRDAGNRCELIVKEGGKHGYLMYERADFDATLERIAEFLRVLNLL